MATTALGTFADVQELMDHQSGHGMVVSCYANMSVSEGIRSLWREHLDREAQLADRALATHPDARRALQRNLVAIRALLSSASARQARGVAAFASGHGTLERAFTLSVPVVNRLVIDEEHYVLPLLEYLHRQRRYLIVHTDSHHGRLYTARGEAVHLIREIEEDVPKRQRAAGERWGKQQATIARHRQDHLLHYRKALVREIQQAWPEERYAGLVLLGEHEVLEHVRKALPIHLIPEVVHEGPRAWVGRQPRLRATVQAVVQAAMHAHDARLAEEVRTRLHEHHAIAAGPQEVIDAIRNGQVGYPGSIVMEPDRGEVGWRCTKCRSIFAQAHDICPYCQAACDKTNLWQAIALAATRHDIPVHFVALDATPRECGGVLAMLARENPSEAAAGIATAGSGIATSRRSA